MIPAVDYTTGGSELPRSKLRGIHSGTIIMGLPPPNPCLPIHPASKLTGILGILVNYPAASCGASAAEQSSWGLPAPNPCLPIHPASKLTGILEYY